MKPLATISFLGTGSGMPSPDLFFSSTLVHLPEAHLLVDVGEPCVHLLRERGNLLLEIDAILITHGHVDHIGGLPALLQGCKLLGRLKMLPIYLPEEMITPLRSWIGACYLIEEQLGFPISWRAWENSKSVAIQENIFVTSHRNGHLDQCYRDQEGADLARACDSYSLEIVAGDFRALFTGDLASANDLKPLLSASKQQDSKPASVLISELTHFTPEELADVLRGASIETLCLVHLSDEDAQNRSELKLQMEELLPDIRDVMVPEDGEVLDF